MMLYGALLFLYKGGFVFILFPFIFTPCTCQLVINIISHESLYKQTLSRYLTKVYCLGGGGEKGGTPIYWLYGYVSLEREWFSSYFTLG